VVNGASEAYEKWASMTDGLRFRSHKGDCHAEENVLHVLRNCRRDKIIRRKLVSCETWDDFCSRKLGSPLLNSGFPWEGMDKWSLIFGVTIWKLCKWQNGRNYQGKYCAGTVVIEILSFVMILLNLSSCLFFEK